MMRHDFNFEQIDANSFVDLLGLRGKRIHSASLDALIGNVFDFAHTIWKSPQLYLFVDHGIGHSFNVLFKSLEIFNKLKPDNSNLSPYEATVLGVSALIHDIGMQFSKYPKLGEDLSPNNIRKRHVQLGHEMILDTINRTMPDKRGGPSLGLPDHHNSFLYDSALVAFAHSGRLFWDKLKETQYDQIKSAGYYRRLRLLAALIRLGDELHTEFARIPELNFLKSPLLDDEGLAHWCACHYVQDVKIVSPGTGGVRIKMYWRVPENSEEREIQEIRTLLQELREKKINNEFNMIQDFLVLEEHTEPCMLEFNLESEPEKNPAVTSLPAEVSYFIRDKLRPYQFGIKETTHFESINQIQLSPEHEHIKLKAESFFLKSSAVKSGHFRLKTGWHTDRMVNCRELCSDVHFINDLCAILSSYYAEFNFTDVLGIGTSAIGIASNLALMLNANILFTFESAEEKSEKRSKYTEYERGIPVLNNSRLLIIDDILGVGTVLHKIISKIHSIGNSPNYIHAFCLFSLGDKNYQVELPLKTKVDYLAAFPDVLYLKEEEKTKTCNVCHEFPDFVRLEN